MECVGDNADAGVGFHAERLGRGCEELLVRVVEAAGGDHVAEPRVRRLGRGGQEQSAAGWEEVLRARGGGGGGVVVVVEDCGADGEGVVVVGAGPRAGQPLGLGGEIQITFKNWRRSGVKLLSIMYCN